MATSRTGTTNYLRWAAEVKYRARRDGIEHCPRCNVWLDYNRGKRPNSAEADHITAHTNGGRETKENGRVLCRRCNQQLGAKVANENKRKRQGKLPQNVTNINFRK